MKTTRITQTIDEDKIAYLLLDKPESSANVLDFLFFEEFNQHLDAIENDSSIKGLVIHSAKKSIFIAGADLTAFNGGDLDEAKITGLISMGQDAFNRLSRLKITTVAAIHGICVGGGLELALACDYRVASHAAATKVGLPEVMLGILPAWGGSTRLPRLIGLPKALAAILSGKLYAAPKARKLGILDGTVHQENLLTQARQWVTRKKRPSIGSQLPSVTRHFIHSAPVSSLLARKVRKDVFSKTLGNYPAPLTALEVVTQGLSGSIEQSLEKERLAFLKLIKTDECKHLVNIFFLQERSKKAQVEKTAEGVWEPSLIKKTAVLGAGVMGAGIVQWLSAKGYPVIWKEINREQLAKGMGTVQKLFSDGVKRKVFSKVAAQQGIDRITPISEDIQLKGVDLVIEAIVEKLEVKQAVFKQLETRVDAPTVLATNTSALSISTIAENLQHPEQLVGIHFFNPVHRMKLVEVVRGKHTAAATLDTALQFVKKIGKLPVVVEDSPGFLVNRVLMPYLIEAVNLFDEGCAVDVLDECMLQFGMPMGPMRLIDEVGLDVAQHVAVDLANRLPHQSNKSDTLQKMLDQGWMGRKSGKGFYVYPKGSKKSVLNTELTGILNHTGSVEYTAEAVVDRMVLAMVNEAARCLEEHVVAAPEDVDFGMIMGTGWAPFRGGPLRYADSLGAETVVTRLQELAKDNGALFKPCQLLQALAKNQSGFYTKDGNSHLTDSKYYNQAAS